MTRTCPIYAWGEGGIASTLPRLIVLSGTSADTQGPMVQPLGDG
ncbi:MAG: hypothetical protein P1V34_13595 [Alphaproteobacteria bacterium]|nr:hypothetical protein [Alphaproteobacteria bacterium]